jgi:hypothetical protein
MFPSSDHSLFSTSERPSISRRWPLAALGLAAVHFVGAVLPAFPELHATLAVAPDAIFRRGQFWRLIVGPFLAGEIVWPAAIFGFLCVLAFGWHLEVLQGRRRLLLLFFGGSIAAAALWSVAALVWNWHRPLFSPVATTALAVGCLVPSLRRPFPVFSRVRVPVWVAFVGYAAACQWFVLTGAIDLSAHFLAGMFAVVAAQSAGGRASPRTSPLSNAVRTPPEREVEAPPQPAADSVVGGFSDFDRRVDDLLRKITDSGYDSLAEDEIALLLEASHRYRNRTPPSA